jgi:hypothetical protein
MADVKVSDDKHAREKLRIDKDTVSKSIDTYANSGRKVSVDKQPKIIFTPEKAFSGQIGSKIRGYFPEFLDYVGGTLVRQVSLWIESF